MKIVKVPLKENAYNIVVGSDILSQIGGYLKKIKIGSDAIIITNPIVKKYYGSKISSSLKKSGFSVKVLEVPDGEQSKSVNIAFELMEKVAKYDVFKKTFIVALGGGVIGDLAGYIAAAYKEGFLLFRFRRPS